MFTQADQTKLADLVRRAAENPMDFRDFADPAKAEKAAVLMASLGVRIGSLMIALSHDRMPPDWRPYRHLSVSDAGKQPRDTTFLYIAREVGMGQPSKWNTDLVELIEAAMPVRLNARHAFQPMVD